MKHGAILYMNVTHTHTHTHTHKPFFLLSQVLKNKEYSVVFEDKMDAPSLLASAVCDKTFVQSRNENSKLGVCRYIVSYKQS